MPARIVPLTPDLWTSFEDLFGKQGACYGCWCTYFRLSPKARREHTGEQRKQLVRARIEDGPPPGLLAFEDEQAVGWMQVGPRADVPQWNNTARSSAPLDRADVSDPSVWGISCFFIRRQARGRGLSHRLLAAGIDFARDHGARRLEACPMVLSKDASSVGLFVGSKRVFDQAGFVVMAQKTTNRPLMRLEL